MNTKTLKLTKHFKLPTAILGAAFCDDENEIVAGCMDGVYVINLNEQSYLRIATHESYVSRVACLKRYGMFVSAGYDGILKWTDIDTREQKRHEQVHRFWAWDMAVSPDEQLLASVTGQYLAGGYKYEPAPETEPSVCILKADTGEVLHRLSHTPSVQAVAFSNDGQFVAAGNLMGEVRIWSTETGQLASSFVTPDFTSWGVIKSHCYLGGIFAIRFSPDDESLLLCGMGPMRDPMAGNGRQLWQRWSWREGTPAKLDETHQGESGEGLMETLAIHPSGGFFAMGGRLRGGDWNVGLFDLESGSRIGELKSGYRVTAMQFSNDGSRLMLVGGQGQPGKNQEGKIADFGRFEVYEFA